MESAAILTPYTGQVRLISNMLRKQGLEQVRLGLQRATLSMFPRGFVLQCASLSMHAAWRRRSW